VLPTANLEQNRRRQAATLNPPPAPFATQRTARRTLLPSYPEALVVEDTELDARFKGNPLVKGFPFIRFYAGCPLIASTGLRLGSL